MLFMGTVMALVLSSCNFAGKVMPKKEKPAVLEVEAEHTSNQLEYVPVRSADDSLEWGLMDLEGTLLPDVALKAEPSNVVGGVFIMSDGHGHLCYYTAEAEPQQIGGEYTKAGLFYEDVAPCIESGKNYIQFIRKDGTVAFELKEVDGKPVEWVGRFHDGLAPFKAGEYIGFVNTEGSIIIAPQFLQAGPFSDGYSLVVDTVDGNEKKYRDKENYRINIIDIEGNTLEHSFLATDSIGDRVSEGLITCSHDYEPEDTLPRIYKFVDPMGRTIIAEHTDYRQLTNMRGTHFAFYSGRGWGIADNQATVILSPRYDEVVWIGEQSAVVCLYGKYKFLDYGGDQLSKSFDEVISLDDDVHFIGRIGSKWYMLDELGTIWGEGQYIIKHNPGDDVIKR